MKSIIILACGIGIGAYASHKFTKFQTRFRGEPLTEQGIDLAGRVAAVAFQHAKAMAEDLLASFEAQAAPEATKPEPRTTESTWQPARKTNP